jgi:hypothetical protein
MFQRVMALFSEEKNIKYAKEGSNTVCPSLPLSYAIEFTSIYLAIYYLFTFLRKENPFAEYIVQYTREGSGGRDTTEN